MVQVVAPLFRAIGLRPTRKSVISSLSYPNQSRHVLGTFLKHRLGGPSRYLATDSSPGNAKKASKTPKSEPALKISLPGQSFTAPPSSESAGTYVYSPTALPPREDPLLHFLVNMVMRDGKKSTAERWVADMLSYMSKLTSSNPLPLVYEAVELAKPLLRMQSRKQGGKIVHTPIPLNDRQSTRRALAWIIQASDRRADRHIHRRLAVEFLAVLEGNSSALSRRDEVHKIGMNNRGNASVRI